ncbi:hypothetical protein JW916_00235 [Candidatus Sumerlaeota bacterium]|nr:hypothetical protein [Candidatus Sumerlaeota bacterium]
MNPRQRYLETLSFGRPDKIPFEPGQPRESTLEVWHEQGLDDGRHYLDAVQEELGLNEDPCGDELDPSASFLMIPQFEEKVIEQRESSLVVQDWKGNVCEILDVYDASYLRSPKDFVTRRWLKLPVENRDDWEAMKERYNPLDPARYPEDFDARCEAWRERDKILGVTIPGPFWQMREWLGAEELYMLFLTDPEWVRDMVVFWEDFVSRVLGEILKRVSPDVVRVSEDIAFKEKSFISPDMTREFLLPTWRRWVEEIRAAGCFLIDMDSDGWIGELIPVWIEAGINVCNPIEVAAGCDVVEFRKRFGGRIAYRGAVDKRLIAKGGEAIENELERIVPPMLEGGGFIPSCDHGVPPDISWPDYLHYCRVLARLTGWL